MSTTTSLETLKINYLTQAQYNTASQNGEINENELYMTPDNGIVVSTEDASSPESYQENSVWLKYGSASGGQADWIVEQGTEGIWTYRKWNSGIAECWGLAEISGLTWSSYTTGGIATSYNSSPAQIPMPTSLFTNIISITANTHYAGSNVGWVANTTFSTTAVLLTFVRNGTTGVMRAFINIKGSWK